MKLSAVIPVYNASNFLPKLLDCFVNQTSKDFEVCIVNDGSTDNSEEIILDFIANHKDIAINYQKIKNSGQGKAREVGINAATSEYICFIDADDYIEPNYFEVLSNIIDKHHPDLVCTNYFINEETKKDNVNFNDTLLNKEDIKRVINPYLIQTSSYTYFPQMLWAKAFKKNMYLARICHKNIKVGEDIAVVVPVILDCNSIYLSSEHIYHYRVNNNSVMNIKKPRNYDDVTNLYEHLIANLSKEDNEYFSLQIIRLIAHVAFNCSITQFYRNEPKKDIKTFIKTNLAREEIKESIAKMDASGVKAKLMKYALRHQNFFLMRLYSKIM